MIMLGVICEVANDKSLVKVDYQDTISEFIPYLAFANSYKRHFTPPRIGEQVLLLKCDNGNAKFALGAIFSRTHKEPESSSQTKEITIYEDGTTISYDTSNSTLEILNPSIININVQNSVNITCQNANLTAQNTTITSPSVLIKGDTTIQGSINTAGAGGSAGTFKINGNLSVTGNIADSRGDLTGHGHSDSDGYNSLPR